MVVLNIAIEPQVLSKSWWLGKRGGMSGCFPQNWGGTKPNRVDTCMILKAAANDRRNFLDLRHDESIRHRQTDGVSYRNSIQSSVLKQSQETISSFYAKPRPVRRSLTDGIYFSSPQNSSALPKTRDSLFRDRLACG
ncbi:hypothetical protein TNCV_4604711 [Trichonephila clavipes]|nr:hypothetical protein TNCV_4604711 [Trichonephila clavipes]